MDAINSRKMTPLHYTADYGKIEAVKLLLEFGAKTGMKTSRNDTPINLATEHGHLL